VTQDEVYKIFAKFVVKNPDADYRKVLQHVMPASRGCGNPDVIHQWYNQWRVLWTELAL
jgi:hypothetical protein